MSTKSRNEFVHFVSPLEKVRFLRSFGPMGRLPFEELAVVAQNLSERAFRSGEMVMPKGAEVERAIIILEGRVRLGEDRYFSAGQSVCFMPMMARLPMPADLVAETDVAAMVMRRDVLLDVYEDRFPIFLNTVRAIAGGVLRLRKQIADGQVLKGGASMENIDGPIGVVERVMTMRKNGVFQAAPLEALLRMARNLVEVRPTKGTTMWRRDDPSGHILIVAKGSLRCELADGRVFHARNGYPTGNLESLAREPRWYQAVVEEEPCVLLKSHTEEFLDVMEDNFDLASDFLAAMARNLMRSLEDVDVEALLQKATMAEETFIPETIAPKP